MKTKGLEETIEFCHNFFDAWLRNPDLKSHREEFNAIIGQIFGKTNMIPAQRQNSIQAKPILTATSIQTKEEASSPLNVPAEIQAPTHQAAQVAIQDIKKTETSQGTNPSISL